MIAMIIIVSVVLGGCSGQSSNIHMKSGNGITDLTMLQFGNDTAKLDGEWEFYWNQLLGPGETDTDLMTGYATLPGSWNNYMVDENAISGAGYATYRLTLMAGKGGRLALKVPRVHTAYKLWVNGKLSAAAGNVGTNMESATPQYLPQIVFFEAQHGNNEIIIQVSNFHHRSGGILESIRVGDEKQILRLKYQNLANDVILFGCLVFIGAYHFTLFFFRKKNTSALYFGLFCILIGIRTLLVGECFLISLFPGFNWEIAHKIMTLTFYSGVPLILMYFLSVFPTYFHARMVSMAQVLWVIFGSLIIFTPASIFTIANPVYQVWATVVIGYLFLTLLKIFINKEKDSWLIAIGASVFLLATLNDIIYLNVWMSDRGPLFLKTLFKTDNLVSPGQLIFAFTNSTLIAKKFSDSLEQKESMTAKLTEMNENLDKIVFVRTQALLESNKKIEKQKHELEMINTQLKKLSLRDPLTKIWNRRKYDETILLEWNRCLRYQRPIALIILDIDNFKNYNDYYGHQAGDECLFKIGKTLSDSLTRSTDMVARYGGEEFVIILSETGEKEAIKIANILRQKIEGLNIPHELSPVNNYLTVSLGVSSTVPSINLSHKDLLENADKALYLAKASGKNKVEFLPTCWQPVSNKEGL